MRTTAIVIGTLLLLGSAGCDTYEVDPSTGKEFKVEKAKKKSTREEQLLELTKKHPDDSRSWLQLGAYYERRRQYPAALNAYGKMQERLLVAEKRGGKRYTGGLFRLGRVNLRLRNYEDALKYFKIVLATKPKKRVEILSNKNYRESHLLMGAIYAHYRQWKKAGKNVLEFKKLGGDHRGDSILIQCEEHLRPRYVNPSFDPEKKKGQPASKKKPGPVNEGK